MRYTYSIGLLILLGAAVLSVMGSPDVEEIHSQYSCCDPKILYNPDCKNKWMINDTPFALSKTGECIPPCVKIQDGVMTLDHCTAVKAIVVCTEQNVAVEQRIYWANQTCAGSGMAPGSGTAPGNHGSVGSVLLAALIAGWFVKQIC